jgi:sugar phosphate isomerase/epimerase
MQPVLHSVSYAGLWGQHILSLPDVLTKAAELGYPAVEIMCKRPHLSVVDHSPEDVRALKAAADDLGLEVASLAAYTNFTAGLDGSGIPLVEMQLGYIERLAEYAQILGASLIRVFTGFATERLSSQAQWTACRDAIREASELAGNHGVALGLQNHHDVAVSPEAYAQFLDDVDHPNCCAMFDAWSPALQDDVDLYGWAKRLAPRMRQTTVADYVRLPRYRLVGDVSNYARVLPDDLRAVPMGEGFIDYRAFFAGLADGGFDGYVAYEMCWYLRGGGGLANLDDTARKSLAAIRDLIEHAGEVE